MKSILNSIFRILLTTSIQLCIPKVICSNYIPTQTECDVQDTAVEDKLIFAHVIFRHGERNIEKSYPNDPYQNESFWPGGFGQLTNAGKKEVYELGMYLRRRYQNLLGKYYSQDKVYIHSTDFDRTLMSAQVLAAGLFPPIDDEVWNKFIQWQPIPVHSIPLTQEKLLARKMPCPRFDFLIDAYRSSPEYMSIIEKYRQDIDEWEKRSGKILEKLVDIMFLYDTLLVENRKGLALPEWAKLALAENNLEYLAAFHMQSFTNTTELKKLEAGFLIKEMLDRFIGKTLSNLDPNRSLWIYAGHDLTLVNILNSLDIFDLHIPPYASSLHFELYQNEAEFYVQLFYRNEKIDGLSPLEIPNCGTKCSLDKFYEVYKDILPHASESFDFACQLSQRA